MEPLYLDEIPPALADLAAQVAQSATLLGGGLSTKTLAGLADLVRQINCYYSNIIEGHHTRPRDVDAALRRGETEATVRSDGDPKKQHLLQLALAHIKTQEWIDRLFLNGQLPDPAAKDFIATVHQHFYESLPEVFREIRDEETNLVRRIMGAGRFRATGEEVSVGRHFPPTGGLAVEAFLDEFALRYAGLRQVGPVQRLCGIAAAHHRLLYIHPFDDGNGRVARLITHAMMLDAGLGACGLWSMSRGLARGIRDNAPYKPKFLANFASQQPPQQYRLLMRHADEPRMGDLDGRGNLSRKRLQEFCYWFLGIALDQILFMTKNFRLSEITSSLSKHYVASRRLSPRDGKILVEIARLGELPRSSIKAIAGVGDRAAANIIAPLILDGILASDDHRGPLRLHFGPDAAEILFPRLFGSAVLD